MDEILKRDHSIAQFRYIKIQLETKDITTRLRGIIHLLLLITAKYAFICANRQSIKRIYIHLHEAAIIYAKCTLICKFCIIFGIQLHYWSFNCAFGHSMKIINFHLREYLYHWREKKIQVRQSKVNSVNITFIYIFQHTD